MLAILSAISFDVSKIDSNAITIFIIGFSVVFGALIGIYAFFYFLPKIFNFNNDKKKIAKTKKEIVVEDKSVNDENSEIFAAIAMALHLHFEDMHDEESMVLTMDIQERLNSQWSSKIININ
jgi:Na+-transporting methylmalonyl-CoA/oxaloacetate decarboxylase gamma subunit